MNALPPPLPCCSDVLQLTKTFKATGDPLHILVNMAGTLFPGSRSIVKGACITHPPQLACLSGESIRGG